MGQYEDQIPPKVFQSDGCSGFITKLCNLILKRNPTFQECCYAHDMAYHIGGTAWQRLVDDWGLAVCVWKYNKLMSPIMFIGVRLGGWQAFGFDFSYGFGWNTESKNIFNKLIDLIPESVFTYLNKLVPPILMTKMVFVWDLVKKLLDRFFQGK